MAPKYSWRALWRTLQRAAVGFSRQFNEFVDVELKFAAAR
jgi:hypothetical protein